MLVTPGYSHTCDSFSRALSIYFFRSVGNDMASMAWESCSVVPTTWETNRERNVATRIDKHIVCHVYEFSHPASVLSLSCTCYCLAFSFDRSSSFLSALHACRDDSRMLFISSTQYKEHCIDVLLFFFSFQIFSGDIPLTFDRWELSYCVIFEV